MYVLAHLGEKIIAECDKPGSQFHILKTTGKLSNTHMVSKWQNREMHLLDIQRS